MVNYKRNKRMIELRSIVGLVLVLSVLVLVLVLALVVLVLLCCCVAVLELTSWVQKGGNK